MLGKVEILARALGLARQPWVDLGNGVGVAVTRAGRKIFLPLDDLMLTPRIISRGVWEPYVERELRARLRPGMVVAEVGANLGYHTLTMAEAVGPGGHIHAFEPYPRVLPLLRRTLAENGVAGQVTLHEAAALDAPGEVRFAADPANAGSAHVAIVGGNPRYVEGFAAPALRMDDALEAVPRLDLLRMDAEGSEGLALRGAQALLRRSPSLVIVMEWSPAMLASRGDVASLAAWIASLGFRCERIGRGGLKPMQMSALARSPHCDVVLSRGV